MKKIFSLSLIVFLFTSCQTSSDLGSTSLIQKRRYSKGYNLNIKKAVESKADQTGSVSMVQSANDKKSNIDNHLPDVPTFKMEKERITEIELASSELSKALLSSDEKNRSQSQVISVVPPSESQKAYTLSIENQQNRFSGSTAPSVATGSGAEVTFLIILLTILLPPLGVALVFGISAEFWISLLLTLLFYFPGLIYSLLVIL